MRIRKATEQDIIQIKTILDRNFDEIVSKFHSKQILEKFKSHNSCESLLSQLHWKSVYVAEDDGIVVATGAFANFGSKEQPKYSISNLYVLPEKHFQGIGKMLYEQLLNDAKACSAKSFYVPSSRNAVGFYEKMGFVVDEMQPDVDNEITWMTMVVQSG